MCSRSSVTSIDACVVRVGLLQGIDAMIFQTPADRCRRECLSFAIFAALGLYGVLAPNVYGQSWGSLSGGRGHLSVEFPDFDRFADGFNDLMRTSMSAPIVSFGSADGWHFDVGYETIFGTVGSAVSSGLHRYSAATEARFVSGAAHEFEITVQDLTGSWEILIYRRYLFFGPGLWFARRRVSLESRETAIGSPLVDQGLVGEYTGSGYEIRWGGVGGIWWGPFRASLRVLGAGRALAGAGRLFDGDEGKLGTASAYFPKDYRAFVEGGVGGRAGASRANVRGRIVEFAVAISFPL